MKYSKIKVKELLSGDLGNVSTDENYKNLLFNKNVSTNLLLEDICFKIVCLIILILVILNL